MEHALWPILFASITAIVAVLSFLRLRKRQVERARAALDMAENTRRELEGSFLPWATSGEYLPDQVRRSLDQAIVALLDRTTPPIAKAVRRTRDRQMTARLDHLVRGATAFRARLNAHNDRYVATMAAQHAALLTDELRLDDAQRVATVRDDVRNLVIAGAGSGKTRTIAARVRFLLARGHPAEAILAVTFSNKATEEMGDRLRAMGVPIADRSTGGVTVSTLHALGKRVVQASLPGPVSVADDRWTDSLVAAALRDARTGKDSALASLYVNAVLHFHRDEDETAPATAADRTYRTLRGEHVRSAGERIVADFCLVHHVPYAYEARASWAKVGAGRMAYHPDFHLPGIGAHVEYWGVDRGGRVAPWLDATSEEYRQGMEWKRAQFHSAGKVLLEFYDYERTEGTLEDALRTRLTEAGATLRPMTFDALQGALGDMKYVGSAIERLLVQFLANARALRLPPKEIHGRLKRATPRVHHFGLLGAAVLERYEAALAREGRIDFSDMLHRAADVLEHGANPLPAFQHVLVDEFQDTSPAMARFLKALLARTGAKLFAVGDDWQAIYGFAGADVDHIVRFESHFGPASTTMLDVNYRSPAVIVEAGAALIARNPKQVPKHVAIASREEGEALVHEVPDDDGAMVTRTLNIVEQEVKRCRPEEVLVLSRTNHALQDIGEALRKIGVPVADPARNVEGVRLISAHGAKGLEAASVIIVNASDHLFGFPSKVENPDVLEPVRMHAGNAQAEERRLFYVALTRATARVHLLARKGHPSPYLAEIEGAPAAAASATDPRQYPVGSRFSGEFHVERLYPLTDGQRRARIRQRGLMTTATSRFSFTSWVPFDLREGATYHMDGVLKDRPYRDRQQVKLDDRTRARAQAPSRPSGRGSVRELRPHPPPSHRPRRK